MLVTFNLPFRAIAVFYEYLDSAPGNGGCDEFTPNLETTDHLTELMKILLQHVRTKLYVHSLGNWTPDPVQACDFQHSQRAINFARDHALTAVQIAVNFVDGQSDEVFPVPPASVTTRPQARA